MSDAIQLIVGLGNPGKQYEYTRHNAGIWFIDALARQYNINFTPQTKYKAITARANIDGKDVRLLVPTTYMNLSGQSVAPFAQFFKIEPNNILVAHDELDMPPGVARLKKGGGHGGHNGLRDIIGQLGNNNQFHRLRIGIGHPGNARDVSDYVLSRPAVEDRRKIEDCIDEAVNVLPDLLDGNGNKAMNRLHSFSA